MRHANDIVGQILLVAFAIIMGGVPLSLLVLGVINFVRATSRRGTIVLQALAALVIWAFLTYAIILIFMVIIFSLPYPLSPADEVKSNGVVLMGALVYAAIGAALIYWTKVQAKLSLKGQPLTET